MSEARVNGYQDWRKQARDLLRRRVLPEEVDFRDGTDAQETLFPGVEEPGPKGPAPRVPKPFLDLAEAAACFRDPSRWNLLYRLLFRLTHGEPELLDIDVDDDVREAKRMSKAVARDIHKMHAFVRFRRVVSDGREEYIAWHRPDHLILERAVPFFVRRFGSMRWAILTPDRSAFWDMKMLRFGPGLPQSAAPAGDDLEDLWRTYYGAIFNPARVKVNAMRAEMPVRHWATLPEAGIISQLLLTADARVETMAKEQPLSARLYIPPNPTLPVLARAAAGCRACALCEPATQTVFGEGPFDARVVIVGEQPGDQEDLAGRPFVGPAGQLLNRAFAEAGIDRSTIYLTNAVKHFKFTREGKRRIHQKPRGQEIAACKPWLEAELDLLRPQLIVALGATAAQSLAGRDLQITKDRGRFLPYAGGADLLLTMHPSAILRMPDPARQAAGYAALVADLCLATSHRALTSARQ